MAIIQAVVTDVALTYWPQMLMDPSLYREIDLFKVGEGGWIQTPSGRVPRTPDPTLTDLDCVINPGRYPTDSLATFSKALVLGDMTFNVGLKTQFITCLVDFGEFNDDGLGNDPEVYEIGAYADNPSGPGKILLYYGTFAQEVKTPAVQLQNIISVAWGR